nr:MAG TPA: hypothetical protein [Caudoviricetes sp.]
MSSLSIFVNFSDITILIQYKYLLSNIAIIYIDIFSI